MGRKENRFGVISSKTILNVDYKPFLPGFEHTDAYT